jgi:hypothetical protein
MEATIHYDSKKTITIVLIFTAVMLAFAIQASRRIRVTEPLAIPSIEVMQWSTDTCWGGWR